MKIVQKRCVYVARGSPFDDLHLNERATRLVVCALDIDKYRDILTAPSYEGGHALVATCMSSTNPVGSIALHFATHSHSATRVEFSTFNACPAYDERCTTEPSVEPKVRVHWETVAGVKRAQDAGTTEVSGKGTLADLTGSGKTLMKGS